MSYWLVKIYSNTPTSFILPIVTDREWLAEKIVTKAYPGVSFHLEKIAEV